MLDNFTFTLYEIFGYLIPGSVALAGFGLIYWALFMPTMPMDIATFQPGLGTWVVMLGGSYILGHAAQGVGNKLLRGVETAALEMKSSPLIRDTAFRCAAKILATDAKDLEARWVYRVLDEYSVQAGQPGDRDMFIYREGFYRGLCIALSFLAITLIVRATFPGTSIKFAHWTHIVSRTELALTTLFLVGLAALFLQRYRRYAEYRVTRAALAALVLTQSHDRKASVGQHA